MSRPNEVPTDCCHARANPSSPSRLKSPCGGWYVPKRIGIASGKKACAKRRYLPGRSAGISSAKQYQASSTASARGYTSGSDEGLARGVGHSSDVCSSRTTPWHALASFLANRIPCGISDSSDPSTWTRKSVSTSGEVSRTCSAMSARVVLNGPATVNEYSCFAPRETNTEP